MHLYSVFQSVKVLPKKLNHKVIALLSKVASTTNHTLPELKEEPFLVAIQRLRFVSNVWRDSKTNSHSQSSASTFLYSLQFPPGSPPRGANPGEGATSKELERLKRRRQELADHNGYSSIQGTRPLTLAYGLNDSPAGLAAWVVDKFWAWSDHGGDLDSSFTKDQLLTTIMIYWVTETMPSSVRLYYESRHPTEWALPDRPRRSDRVPVGVALFPKEIHVPPRTWVEPRYNLVHWTEMPRGGHFAALEEPELFVEDVRKFFRLVR